MKMFRLKMQIVEKVNQAYKIEIKHNDLIAQILFEPENKVLKYLNESMLSELIKKNEYQLRTMLHNKRKDTYYVGFRLIFYLRDGKDVAAFNDRTKIVVLDKRNNKHESYVIEYTDKSIHKIYTDASFADKIKKGGFAVLHEDLEGNYELYTESSLEKSSNLLELLAAIKGLEVLKEVDEIRIVTDSQYVRKGLTEWILNWELNDWMTVNGEKVKNIDQWKKFNALSKGKYIEFEWVKAHSNHFGNTICDLYAKQAAEIE
jgi:ribonuclease HI